MRPGPLQFCFPFRETRVSGTYRAYRVACSGQGPRTGPGSSAAPETDRESTARSTPQIYSSGGYGGRPPRPRPPGRDDGGSNGFTTALICGAFILGIGAGVWFDSEANFEPSNVASTSFLDDKTPNSEVCMANGYSSMVFDQRVFVSLNPFNVYVSQPEVKPGCVLRRANVNVLENRKLIRQSEVESCKKRMNTFAYVGDLESSPEISCVYHSEDAENQYLIDPKKAVMGDGFQKRTID
eukprot:CAMPEP_0117680540 /NCGR_PEP_ID=MMETSP0804-20121206/18417_1 /TAXON_ID=1074897 /ORGANISM="Tetraselmis astigmatica, Strain CCMP880" /LENGTH=238 /DNA_ID=CAMNT_0005490065 /DNA_START=237 /DNA_END=953 /DNA_ORIENTATION=+